MTKRQATRGYFLPEEVLGHDLICVQFMIPNTIEYRAAVRAQLFDLGKWTTWDRARGDDTLVAATLFRGLLAQYLSFTEDCEGMMFPCPDPCPELPDWIFDPPPWLTNPSDIPPWENPPGDIPEPGENGVPVDQDICCLQAANATLTIARLTADFVTQAIAASNPTALATILAGMFALFGLPALLLLVTLAVWLLQNYETLEEDLTEAFDELRCILLDHCGDGVFIDLDLIKSDITARIASPLDTYFNIVMDALQLSGLQNAAALGELTEFDCADCLPCGLDQDLRHESRSDIISTTSGCISWVDGSGWRRTGDCGNYYLYLEINEYVSRIELEAHNALGIEAIVINNTDGGSYFGLGSGSPMTPVYGGTDRVGYNLTCQFVHKVRMPVRSLGTPDYRAIVAVYYECCEPG